MYSKNLKPVTCFKDDWKKHLDDISCHVPLPSVFKISLFQKRDS